MADVLISKMGRVTDWLAPKWILDAVGIFDRHVSRPFAGAFFSADVSSGRLIGLAMLLCHPRNFSFAVVGSLLTAFFARAISQNVSLRKSGVFALNGVYAGLAISSFVQAPEHALPVLTVTSAFVAIFVVAGNRFLKTWDLPLLVAPYCAAVWAAQVIASQSRDVAFRVLADSTGRLDHGILSVAQGALLSFGQIFYSGNWMFSLAVLAILARMAPRSALYLGFSAICPSLVAYVLVGDHWAVSSGLTGFIGVLLFQSRMSGGLSLSAKVMWIFIALSGLAEIVALRISFVQGVFALSSGYVAFYWLMRFCEETRQAPKNHGAVVSSSGW